MNREIKFRVWQKDRQRMHQNIFSDMFGEKIKDMELSDYEFVRMLSGRFDNYQVMQFTGLKDKNGKEIYEGDILESQTEEIIDIQIGRVFFDESRGGYFIGNNQMNERLGYGREYKVIGNIYENPELLTPNKT